MALIQVTVGAKTVSTDESNVFYTETASGGLTIHVLPEMLRQLGPEEKRSFFGILGPKIQYGVAAFLEDTARYLRNKKKTLESV